MKIEMKNGKLVVPDYPAIGYIRGDGVGEDIFPQAQKVFDAAVLKIYGQKKKIEWQKLLAGGEAFETCGEYLPKETLAHINENLIAIKGPLMTPVGESFRSINVTLRQKMDLYACVRPVEYFKGIKSPVKAPEKVDMTIFRENTEDIYAGIEFASETNESHNLLKFLEKELNVHSIRFPKTSALGIKPVSPEGSKRLVNAAFEYALKMNKKRVTFVHKGNIMKFTEGGFRNWAYEVAREYPTFTKLEYDEIKNERGSLQAENEKKAALKSGKIYVDDVIADNFLQQIILNPENFEVIATLNLNGDYISDALAAQVGGIGIAPGANINYKSGHAIFEATHGTAPDIAGKNIANPSSLILSGVMMFEYLGWQEVAELIKIALSFSFRNGNLTADLGGKLLTSKFSDVLIDFIKTY
ncbi:NADP-dependent isocitrate dehydrogenase [Lactococcus lactis subsp. lactis]|uniref:Isocitrate dehydrogenase [NADP] n=1 Tax=Lactococcus lactis subsp. lactis TaxID=1360 RepID=A0A1V0NEJ2_LACLL|nr:NADP-dependent isocitrate dehydrogenase [Lactococcus lactis]ADZ63231.1 isocitrate dehydrogenase [Lactococcus lactis subsp. lactis CV56]ARD98323.1 isocitrate dehydrogenase (NADP) [Lactococcus lactis subsp. lactis]EHE94738.1 Isocitrate dehydrogenase (NADP(+)) [Lactococcus lactis subsp. lactis CNCM I-1631]KAF0953139.1 NADP-dependent isocitrate dehydrogenase [Lactococcus lactis subsp. lactis]KSU31486.1 Isocitrate dehydrogenase (NADP) [Lactococcus lactis subsp. lactis]